MAYKIRTYHHDPPCTWLCCDRPIGWKYELSQEEWDEYQRLKQQHKEERTQDGEARHSTNN